MRRSEWSGVLVSGAVLVAAVPVYFWLLEVVVW